jgi:hypothetical protein
MNTKLFLEIVDRLFMEEAQRIVARGGPTEKEVIDSYHIGSLLKMYGKDLLYGNTDNILTNARLFEITRAIARATLILSCHPDGFRIFGRTWVGVDRFGLAPFLRSMGGAVIPEEFIELNETAEVKKKKPQGFAPKITVNKPALKIKVNPSPQITVNKPAPKITVNKPAPKITVKPSEEKKVINPIEVKPLDSSSSPLQLPMPFRLPQGHDQL